MSTPLYTITQDDEAPGKDGGIVTLSTITLIFKDGSTRAINSTNPNFKAVVQAVVIDEADEEQIIDLLTPTLSVGKSLRALSERIRYDAEQIWFDGDVIDNSLAKHIVRILNEGEDESKWHALVNFMEKLYTNPSKKSIDSLYEFLVRQNITILPDGDFLAYKGLRSDATSIHAGEGIVNGKFFKHANLKNDLGSVIEIPRSKVDADTSRGCSTGLHAGSYAYAKGFAQGMLVTVKINPRDVVSVPDDCSYQKIRTSRYVVMAQTEIEYTATTWADEDYDDDDDWSKDDEDSYGDEEIEELREELENWRDAQEDRDFTEQPLTQAEANMLSEASDYEELADDEEEALSAFHKKSLDSGVQSGAAFFDSISNGLKNGSIGGSYDEVIVGSADRLRKSGVITPEVQAETKKLIDESGLFSKPTQDVPAAPRTSAITKPSVSEFAKQLRAEIEGEENVSLSFDYTRGDGSQTSVEGFHPTEVEERHNDLYITGKNADERWRSYYYGQMENISVRDADTEPKHAS